MTVAVQGLDRLKRRFEARGLGPAVHGTLRGEGERVAADAARAAPGRLGGTVEVIDESRGDKQLFRVGTPHRAGRYLEYGTVARAATPWLWPAFRAGLPRIKQRLGQSLRAVLRETRGAT